MYIFHRNNTRRKGKEKKISRGRNRYDDKHMDENAILCLFMEACLSGKKPNNFTNDKYEAKLIVSIQNKLNT